MLETVSLPACEKINRGAFYGCTLLKTLTIPAECDLQAEVPEGCEVIRI